jgi:drug/metabolite transporter superfamily protein YnfA
VVGTLAAPAAVQEVPARRGRSMRWIGVALLALAVVAPLLRQRGTPSWQTVWAEDGSIYTHQAIIGGFDSLFRGYNGYLQLPARLIAIPTPYFSLRYLGLYMSLAATITGALLAWSLFHLTQSWLPSRLLRVTLASFVVLAPAVGIESTATVTNTIWMFLAVLPWALVSFEERSRDTVLRSALVFLGATSSLLSVIFVPLGVGWVFYRRTRATWAVGAAFIAGLVV